MSDLVLNLRVAFWHFQIGREKPHFRFSYNAAHRGKLGKESAWVELY